MPDRPLDPSKRDPNVLDAVELGNRLAVHPVTIRKMAHAGELPGARIGSSWRFWWPAVVEHLSKIGLLTDEDGPTDEGEGEAANAVTEAREDVRAPRDRLPTSEPATAEPPSPPKRRGTPRLPKGERPPAQ